MITEKENFMRVLAGERPQWIPDFFQACMMADYGRLGYRYEKDTGHWIDAFGVVFEDAPDGRVPIHGRNASCRLSDIENWKSVIPDIDFGRIDWEAEAAAIRAKAGEDRIINLNAGYIWEQMHFLMGFENAFVALLTEPDICAEFFNALADFWIEALRRIYPYLKPELVMLFDHLATERGTLIAPDTYRQLIKPADRRFIEAVRDLGAYAELHCDGNIEELLPDFAEIGVQVLQPLQVFNDINAAKEKYGFIAIGGWDSFGPGNQKDATEEEIRQSVRTAMDRYGEGNRYVFWESGVTPVFQYNARILADEAYHYGRSRMA